MHFFLPQWLCKAVGIALHFSLTAMFSWTLVEGWHLYLALIEVLCAQKRSLLKRYYILGYGEFGLLVVGLFVLFRVYDWLSTTITNY